MLSVSVQESPAEAWVSCGQLQDLGVLNVAVYAWDVLKRSPLPSLLAQMVKHLPTMWETRVQSLGREDLLEKEMSTHSSILAWKNPWSEEPGRLQSMGSQRVGHD